MTTPRLRFALFGNIFQTKKNQHVTAILEKIRDLGGTVSIEEQFADFMTRELGLDVSSYSRFRKSELPDIDVAVSIGGDGTFLGTAAAIGDRDIPIMGINTGRLGFLADVSPDVVGSSLEALCSGNYVVEERDTLIIRQSGDSGCEYALNEVAVLKHDNSSLIEISTYVDGSFLTNYLADGLIVSTATGSTGYSLSVGGPILMPGSETFCIAPVAPHSLTVRPVVVRNTVGIKMTVRSRSHNFLLACDGRSRSLPDATEITVSRAAHTIKVIKIEHKHFFDTLRDKLMWGADPRI